MFFVGVTRSETKSDNRTAEPQEEAEEIFFNTMDRSLIGGIRYGMWVFPADDTIKPPQHIPVTSWIAIGLVKDSNGVAKQQK